MKRELLLARRWATAGRSTGSSVPECGSPSTTSATHNPPFAFSLSVTRTAFAPSAFVAVTPADFRSSSINCRIRVTSSALSTEIFRKEKCIDPGPSASAMRAASFAAGCSQPRAGAAACAAIGGRRRQHRQAPHHTPEHPHQSHGPISSQLSFGRIISFNTSAPSAPRAASQMRPNAD